MNGDPVQSAEEWWDNCATTILNNPDVDYWEGYNEPGNLDVTQMQWYAEFEGARVNILAQHGRKACIGNFSTGTPDITNPNIWPAFYPAIDSAIAHSGILGLHEYGCPMQQSFDDSIGEGWLCGRYRKVYNQHLILDNKVIPLVITECGVDGDGNGQCTCCGWKLNYIAQEYFNQLVWYDNILKQDTYVLGGTIFCLEIPNWDDFDIAEIMDTLTAYVSSSSAEYGESPYIYGMHDPGGESHMADMGTKGWIVFPEAIGHDPSNNSGVDYTSWADSGYGVIVRFQHGWGNGGCIPYDYHYDDFAIRCGNFVVNSPGAHIWIIGNEPNLSAERPSYDGPVQVITSGRYISCYKKCRANIRSRPGHENDQVVIAPIGPWNVETGDWIAYFDTVLNALIDSADAIGLHTYTHGTDPNLVFSDETMNPPYQDRYYHFRAYKNFMETIPPGIQELPVYITETNENDPWADTNSGWVKNAYSEINSWNTTPGNQKIRTLCLYRWPNYDQWYIEGKWGVINDWRDAMTYGYRWDTTLADDAIIVSHTIPDVMTPTETRTVNVTVKNTGTNTWVGSGASNMWRLGAGTVLRGNPHDNEFIWSNFVNGGYSNSVTDQRCYLGGDVFPNNNATFTFDVTASGDTGMHWFEARMVHDGVTWFGKCVSIGIDVELISDSLLNPGFELGNLTHWSIWGEVDGVQTGPWFANIMPHSGTYFLGTAANWGQKNGGVYQRVGFQPGEVCTASVWICTYRVGGNALDVSCRLGLDSTGGTNPTSPNIEWTDWVESDLVWTQIQKIVTVTSSAVTVFIEHHQAAPEWNVNCFDDVKLNKAEFSIDEIYSEGYFFKCSPNPFGKKMLIEYRVPRKMKVSLKLYNILGDHIKTLVEGERDSKYYRISIEIKNFANGIYFIKFITDDYKETKKLILIKEGQK